MTVIDIKRSSEEYKKGFKVAVKIILNWCEGSENKTIPDLIELLKAGTLLSEIVE